MLKRDYKKSLNVVILEDNTSFIEILDRMKHYWVVKHEFQGIDSVGGNTQLSTVQLDIKDAKTYGITFINQKGEKQGAIICHSSIGAIERWIFSILEDALKKEKPSYPLWLAPTQIKILPISEKHIKESAKVAEYFQKNKIRVNIDDRNLTLNKKILEANKEWTPFLVVVGDKEIKTKKLATTERNTDGIKIFTKEQLKDIIREKTKDKPFRNLSLPLLISKWPKFFG